MTLKFDADAVKRLEDTIRLRMFRRLASMRFERVERAARHQRDLFGPSCGARVECGGNCCLEPNHAGDHSCIGDEPWQPGSCPA